MASAAARRAIVLVNGAWHKPTVWNTLIQHMASNNDKQQQFTISAVELPSCGSSEARVDCSDLDTAAVRAHIAALVEQGYEVTVVSHSYGGVPASQACEGLSRTARRAAGYASGGVVACVYVCSFLLPAGLAIEKVGGVVAVEVQSRFEVESIAPGLNVVTNPNVVFYHDLPANEAAAHAAGLVSMDTHFLTATHTYLPQTEVPVTYVVCTQDVALPPAHQLWMAETAQASVPLHAQGLGVRVERMGCGHSPMLVLPGRLAEIIRQAAERGHLYASVHDQTTERMSRLA